ncbi:unnamed protein product [Dovyalis caffra]|uniref:F-box domain-containing protein n=1 Tax=Dovyalis caffra TaxID=77055 RepID=A0AAV1RP09_9ROSI|nr:unnamed protein product [Dovyalis caffra]
MDAKRKRAANPESSSPAESKCLVAQLPHGLILDILSRLPIKSLFSCKLVCKTWLHLISDPHFAKLHLSKSSTAILIRDVCFRSTELLSTQFVEEVHDKTVDVEKMRFVPNTNLPDTEFHVINSCKGLLCLDGKSKGNFNQMIYVCNPILGEYVIIPVFEKLRKWEQYFALGFSSVSNQYKVLQTYFPDRPYVNQCRAEVYTVGTGQWRSIGNAPFSLDHLDANAFLHDSVHWIDYSPENDGFICAFDFGFEHFKRLALPIDSQKLHGFRDHAISCVGVLKAWLFVAFDVCSEWGDLEIWVMEEYGIKESWSKKFVVDFISYQPLFTLGSGKILMFQRHQCIVCYDPKSKSIQDTGISQGMECIGVTAYTPSFVSLQDIAKGEELKSVDEDDELEAFTNIKGIYQGQAVFENGHCALTYQQFP